MRYTSIYIGPFAEVPPQPFFRKVQNCSQCGAAAHSATAKFCIECGGPIERRQEPTNYFRAPALEELPSSESGLACFITESNSALLLPNCELATSSPAFLFQELGGASAVVDNSALLPRDKAISAYVLKFGPELERLSDSLGNRLEVRYGTVVASS